MSMTPKVPPYRMENAEGLSIEINRNGTIRRFANKDIVINLFPGNEVEAAPANLFLRCVGEPSRVTPLLGPNSPSRFGMHEDCFVAEGEFEGVRYQVRLVLAEDRPAWCWQIQLENRGSDPIEYDLIYAQDLAIAPYGAIRLNEYYVSQYIDHEPLCHPGKGYVVASRQNQAVGGRYPWSLIGSLRHAQSYSTDALQFHGLDTRRDLPAPALTEGLPGILLQHEHALVDIQDQVTCLAPGEGASAGFYGWIELDHPEATSPADLGVVDEAVGLFESLSPVPRLTMDSLPPKSLFDVAPTLACVTLDAGSMDQIFGTERREAEYQDGHLLSFFTGQRTHVVLKGKEEAVLRPHGHILRTGGLFQTEETVLTSTTWMNGVFHSMVTQGHVSINRFLSTTHSYLGLFKSHGLCLFIDAGHGWTRLGLPSAYSMAPEACRWIYRHHAGLIEVVSRASTESHILTLEVNVLEGSPIRCLFSHHVAMNGDDGAQPLPAVFERQGTGIRVGASPESEVGRRFPDGGFKIDPLSGTAFETVTDDAFLFPDGVSRSEPFVCVVTTASRQAGLRIEGDLIKADHPVSMPDADTYWRAATAGLSVPSESSATLLKMAEILPWFAHNALIHFLAPRGLEQYSGGGWGTRDVAQGPVEYLLAIGQFEPIRALLLEVFRNQNPDGDWPQWFMYLHRERNIRPNDSHGDIIFWPLLATAQYLEATGDQSFLKERVPFFASDVAKEESLPIYDHLIRALGLIGERLIPGTRLEAYGHGDWNDSLQPADPSLRDHLCSSWTVTLHYQVLISLASALGGVGESVLGGLLETEAQEVLADFRKHLLVDGVIPGYVNFEDPEAVAYLLHPLDHKTGLRYSLLPMIHAVINHMLTPEEAKNHFDLIEAHLKGPDGARLFDRPMVYRGGPMRIFQRAETATYFGREIGLMYTHAHLRYAEALWQFGDAEAFFEALSKAIPIGVKDLVKTAALRQANCYFSSSDATFRDRYQAYEEYDLIREGGVTLEGGWRVYSSGAGIASGLILRSLFGLRVTRQAICIDPLIPEALAGLCIELDLGGHRFAVRYQRKSQGVGPVALTLNGTPLTFDRVENPYRLGGVRVDTGLWDKGLVAGVNQLEIELS